MQLLVEFERQVARDSAPLRSHDRAVEAREPVTTEEGLADALGKEVERRFMFDDTRR